VAHRGHDAHTVYGDTVTLFLLALGVSLHYGWALVPVEHQAQAWNILGAAVRVSLLVALLLRIRSKFAYLVAAWWIAEELLVIGCSALYILAPWEIPPGQAQCYAIFHYDLGKAGALVITVLLALIAVRSDR